MPSTNFGFLVEHDLHLAKLGAQAEAYFAQDPNTCLLKLRQFIELLAQNTAAKVGFFSSYEENLHDTLRRLEAENVINSEVSRLFHSVRKAGNQASHAMRGTPSEALYQLKNAAQLAIWFHSSFGADRKFTPGAFVPPQPPPQASAEVLSELNQLREELARTRAEAEAAQSTVDYKARLLQEAAEEAQRAAEVRAVWETTASELEDETIRLARIVAEHEQEKETLRAALIALQEKSKAAPKENTSEFIARAQAAAGQITLSESDTRRLIDEQLRQAGWEADSQTLKYSKGARPAKNTNRAIAEWPTEDGRADYVLFVGLVAIGVIEAKRKQRNSAGAIEQAKRYSTGFKSEACEVAKPLGVDSWSGWKVSSVGNERYLIPFLYATNGRPYLLQLQEESGIHFLDARKPSNSPRALDGWHRPETLKAMLEADTDSATQALQQEPTDYLKLRDYQLRAITAAEQAIIKGQRSVLLAMATGTGKTRMAIGLIYRLLKSKRFRRILFLVDRESLGDQAQNAFKEMRLEGDKTFAEIYEVKELKDSIPEPQTKVHVATVQGMVKRILWPSDDSLQVSIDRYDCIIVDESHRGYTLDREMTEGESETRSLNDYVSTYRRVLDHFDAVKIGLTATPALHTTTIFGNPVFTYGYREAVVDGWLSDEEPPIRIVTQLLKTGILFSKGQTVTKLYKSGQVKNEVLPDELDFDVDAFNRQVITKSFNEEICKELATRIDPNGREKTLVFCVNDQHADLFVSTLKQAFKDCGLWGEVDDSAVRKITGNTDKPMDAIRRYKNEHYPSVAVTVDLLTTGIDVPAICNLVFVRRVRSRILYEQMVGRATRRCDEIGKQSFRIFDAVDLYAALEEVSEMKPVVRNVSLTLKELLVSLLSPDMLETPGNTKGRSVADDALEQIVTRLHRSVRALGNKTPDDELQSTIDSVEQLFGCPLASVAPKLRALGAAQTAQLFQQKPETITLLTRFLDGVSSMRFVVVSHHQDKVVAVFRDWGQYKKPQDYLDAFQAFLKDQKNLIPALTVVLTKPRDLTRAQLKELRAKLDANEFSEKRLQLAWSEMKNEDIAASIIGFIRQKALGSPLVPYSQRVDKALTKILSSRAWTVAEKKWLERIASQMKQEVIVDEEAFSRGAFSSHGGWNGVNRALGGKLRETLDAFGDAIWEDPQTGTGS